MSKPIIPMCTHYRHGGIRVGYCHTLLSCQSALLNLLSINLNGPIRAIVSYSPLVYNTPGVEG